MPYRQREDTVRDIFRAKVLEALDKAAEEAFPLIPGGFKRKAGAIDGDLPDLFKAIDAQVDRLAVRYQCILTGGWE